MNTSVQIEVVVPSFQRPEILANCLEALARQEFGDFAVLCVCRSTDMATRDVVASFAGRDERFVEILVEKPGLVAALQAGLHAATSEVVTFTDDDAEAPPHWLATIVAHFEAHPECGAVGGPDRIQVPEPRLRSPKPARRVGVYSWLGGYYATHHHPILEPYLRCLVLKGVNMSFRRKLISHARVGSGLIGASCAVGTEQGLCAEVIKHGSEVHFLRDAWVLHHCAPRQQSDNRLDLRSEFALSTAYNRAYVLCRFQSLCLSLIVLLRVIVLGSKYAPGLLRCIIRGRDAKAIVALIAATMRGALSGLAARFLGASEDRLVKSE